MNTKLGTMVGLLSLLSATLPLVACGAAVQGDGPTGTGTVGQASGASVPSAAPSSGAPVGGEHGRHGHGWGKAAMARWDEDGDGKIVLADVPERAREHLARADANGDGVVTREELDAARSARRQQFEAAADANHDGTVTPEERRAAFERLGEARFAERDANGDGALSADEVGARRWAHVQRADANGDGKVTKDELRAAFESGRLGAHDHHDGHGAAEHDEAAPAPAASTTL